MALELPKKRLEQLNIQLPQRKVPLEAILAVEGQNPLARAVEEIGRVVQKRAELRKQGEQLAKFETLGGLPKGSLEGLDLSTAASFASTGMKQNADIKEEARKLQENVVKVRALEKQFGYQPGELGDDHPSALMKVQNDLLVKRQTEGVKSEQFKEKQANAYSKQLENTGIPNAIAIGERALTLLPERGTYVPGFGPLEKYVPNILAGDKGRTLRQAASQLFNVELKNRSGAAVTDPELNRLKIEFGQGNFATEESLRQGIQQYLERVKELARNVNAGFSPDILSEYQSRGGRDIEGSLQALLDKPAISKLQEIQTQSPVLTATNKKTGQRIVSTDGGKTWQPAN